MNMENKIYLSACKFLGKVFEDLSLKYEVSDLCILYYTLRSGMGLWF